MTLRHILLVWRGWTNTCIYIIIIVSCRLHGYPWPYFATPPYRSSLLVGPQGYIPYPHRAVVCRFELVVLLLLGHMSGSIVEHHLWARPCFFSNVLVRLTLIVFVMGGRWPYSWCFVGCCLQDLFKIARSIVYIYIYIYVCVSVCVCMCVCIHKIIIHII